jgi:hypothetical protein
MFYNGKVEHIKQKRATAFGTAIRLQMHDIVLATDIPHVVGRPQLRR